jgi:hypothetical protein
VVSETERRDETVFNGEVNNKVESLLDSFVQPDVLTVWSTARHAKYLQFEITANSLEIRAIQSHK